MNRLIFIKRFLCYCILIFLFSLLTGCNAPGGDTSENTSPVTSNIPSPETAAITSPEVAPGISAEVSDSPSPQDSEKTSGDFIEDDGTLLDAQYNGLLDNQVTCMAFDHKDILWIANGNKVVVYRDGSIRFFDTQSDNLPVSRISEIFVDSDNKKWFGTYDGDIFTYNDSEWVVLPAPGLGGIYDILQDKTGEIWVLGYNGICRYRNNQVYQPFVFKKTGYTVLGVADTGDIIIAGTGSRDVLRHNGETIEVLSSEFEGDLYVLQMAYDAVHNKIYFELGNAGGFDEGIYVYENGALRELPYKLIRTKYESGWSVNLHVDEKGTLWARYYSNNWEIARLSGDTWESFEPVATLPGYKVDDIAVSTGGNIWFAGSYRYSPENVFDNSQYGPLASYNGSAWTVYPVLKTDPRLWWHNKDLSELIDEPVITDELSDILANPADYWGKKIRITGSLKHNQVTHDWLLPSTIADINGNDLRIQPYDHTELRFLLADTGIIKDLIPEDNREFIGYLEYNTLGGAFTFMPQLCVTEIYPLTDDAEQRDVWLKQYRDYLSSRELDTQEIRKVLEQWRLTRSKGQISQVSDTPPETLTIPAVRKEWERQPLGDIRFEYTHISFEGDTARAYVYGLTIDPVGAFFQSEAFTGGWCIYINQYFELMKAGNSWQITEEILRMYPHSSATIPVDPTASPFPADGPIAEPSDNSVYEPAENAPYQLPPFFLSPIPTAIPGITVGSGEWTTFSDTPGQLLCRNVSAIVEDKNGNIWVAGSRGVSCYNGSTWKTYTRADGLAREDVYGLFVDNNGDIWAATGEGLNRFDGEKWHTIVSGFGGRNDQYHSVFVDSKGNLWGGALTGINLFDGEKWQRFPFEQKLPGLFVKKIYEDNSGCVYFFLNSSELKIYDNGDWSTIEGVWAAVVDNNGVPWCLSGDYVYSHSLYYLDNDAFWRPSTEIAIPEVQPREIYWDKQGYFWLSTVDGLRCYSGEIYQSFTEEDGLVDSSVITMFQDSRGNYWFGTHTSGLSRFSPDKH